jgi:signal transduction histidine kinase
VVEVAGFPAVTATRPILRNAVLRRVGREAEPQASPLRGDALGQENDAELVRMEAELLGGVAGPREHVLVLRSGDAAFSAAIARSSFDQRLATLLPGSRVAVTGVYALQWGPPPSFRLLLRSPLDVELLAAAPWWTWRHSAVVLAAVALVGLVAAVWARAAANRNALVRQRYQAIMEERVRLARELHDTLEQGLAGTALQLEAVAGSLGPTGSPAARSALDVARRMLRFSLDEARRSVMDLRSRALESQDLGAALRELAREMTEGAPTTAEVTVVGAGKRLAPEAEHHLLRIGLEALANALKHSGARTVGIELAYGPDGAALEVRDDGCGFDYRDRAGAGHFGLRGIRERVDKLSGVLEVRTAPGQGTTIRVRVPGGEASLG